MKSGKLPNYQLYNMISILLTRYKKTTHFAELNLSVKQTRLLAVSQNKVAQTLGKKNFVYKKMLNKFATQT